MLRPQTDHHHASKQPKKQPVTGQLVSRESIHSAITTSQPLPIGHRGPRHMTDRACARKRSQFHLSSMHARRRLSLVGGGSMGRPAQAPVLQTLLLGPFAGSTIHPAWAGLSCRRVKTEKQSVVLSLWVGCCCRIVTTRPWPPSLQQELAAQRSSAPGDARDGGFDSRPRGQKNKPVGEKARARKKIRPKKERRGSAHTTSLA